MGAKSKEEEEVEEEGEVKEMVLPLATHLLIPKQQPWNGRIRATTSLSGNNGTRRSNAMPKLS